MNNGSICIFLGMWLFISGFVAELFTPLNLTICGLVALGISLYGILVLKRKRALIIGILGIWLFMSGFVLGFIAPFSFIFIGFIIALLGFTCICRPDEDENLTDGSLKEQLRNCFKFHRN